MCFRISTSRSFGGAFVTQPWTRCSAAAATSSTARWKSSSFALEGLFAPLSLRTNCSDEARISASVAGGAKLASVRMLRHMRELYPSSHEGGMSSCDKPTSDSREKKMHESSFEGVGGVNIFTRSWLPEREARAVMVLVHGFNAHSGYMTWAAEQFAANGLACYALDLRGRGKSGGERFFVEKFDD